jgi:hypothetical protein
LLNLCRMYTWIPPVPLFSFAPGRTGSSSERKNDQAEATRGSQQHELDDT